MRILHLGYEDPVQPGSGGGSVRTREVNRRLSSRHDITVLVAGYPGAKPHVEEGVRWQPLWPRSGRQIDRLAYFALLGPAIQRHPHDLVIEEFSAPFSTGFAPVFTRKPVIASVQWLFAEQMREKYHLPFDFVEKKGFPLYQDFIAVSAWLARMIHERRPSASVTTIPNGIDSKAFSVDISPPKHLLFVGRLDICQKGCDLLVDIAARGRNLLGDAMPPLLIIGDGPDRPLIEREVQKAGLGDVIRFCGRMEGKAKFELMASAHAVLMPSRFETFGIVAVEGQASGAPVISFDIGPLREVTGGVNAYLIPPFDLDAFAREIAKLVINQENMNGLRQSGRRWARKYDWDVIAGQQEELYLQVASTAKSLRPSLNRTDASPDRQ